MPRKPNPSKKKRLIIGLLIILVLSYLGYNISVDISKTNKSVKLFSNKSISSLLDTLVLQDQSGFTLLGQIRSSTALIATNQNDFVDSEVLVNKISHEINSVVTAEDEVQSNTELETLNRVYQLRLAAVDSMIRCFYSLVNETGLNQVGNCLESVAGTFNNADIQYRQLNNFENKYGSGVGSAWVLGNSQWSQSSVYDWATQLATQLQLNGVHSVNVPSWSVSPTPVRYSSSGYDVLPPTQSITVSVVINNNGSYIENNVPVTLELLASDNTVIATRRSTVSLLPSGVLPIKGNVAQSNSVNLTLNQFAVNYSHEYYVSLQVGPLLEQSGTAITKNIKIDIAPNYTVPT